MGSQDSLNKDSVHNSKQDIYDKWKRKNKEKEKEANKNRIKKKPSDSSDEDEADIIAGLAFPRRTGRVPEPYRLTRLQDARRR